MPVPSQDKISQTQSGASLYEKMLTEYLTGEIRLVNSGLPQRRKQLSDLLNEEHPYVLCNDSSMHFFKKSELDYLASILNTEEQRALSLPMLIEVGTNQAEAAILCEGKVEEKVVSKALDMPVTCEDGKIRLYKPQLALLRKKFKTATVYVFSPRIIAQIA